MADLTGMRDWIDGLDARQRGALAAATLVVLVGVAMTFFPVTAEDRFDNFADAQCGSAIVAAATGSNTINYACQDAGQARVTAAGALILIGIAAGAVGVALFAPPNGQQTDIWPSGDKSNVE